MPSGVWSSTFVSRLPTTCRLGLPESHDLRTSGPAHQGLVALREAGLPTGALTAFDVLVPGGDPTAVAERPRRVDGVAAVLTAWAARLLRVRWPAVSTVQPDCKSGESARIRLMCT
ncbi:hypothetical protein FE391_39195 [Nonomuraea sp. KC401]|uniref:hypothetical protein n=1 Tax=unclassified Nonomuraea TaxID=2593643 RepID=UPI0010FF4C38|nr:MULTISPECIES: hypothetical protein [unclassified Nonomuraea]NBE99196.1 hypothetical protein [Nonomuraea sp. K271]TLF56589.1 hypothetical protein FE391_39195 [Nonomuraea sp. KC401]